MQRCEGAFPLPPVIERPSAIRSPVRRGHRGQQGQVLVIFIFALAIFLGFLALVIDVGLAFGDRRHAQNAADAAALAGAAYLPESPPDAVAAALDWAARNGFQDGVDGVSVTVTTPYDGDSRNIKVQVGASRLLLFARVLGFTSWEVGASAVGQRWQEYIPPLFAHDDACNSKLRVNASQILLTGDVISNSDLKMTGSEISVNGAGTYMCDVDISGSEVWFAAGPYQLSELTEWPIVYTYDDFGGPGGPSPATCTFYSTDTIKINQSTPQYWKDHDPETGELKAGLYCSEKDIKLTAAQGASGTVTFAAKNKIDFNGSGFNLTSYWNGILAFAGHAAADAMEILGSGFTWQGLLLAPNGHVKVANSSLVSPAGAIWSETMSVNTSFIDITGTLDISGGNVRLLE